MMGLMWQSRALCCRLFLHAKSLQGWSALIGQWTTRCDCATLLSHADGLLSLTFVVGPLAPFRVLLVVVVVPGVVPFATLATFAAFAAFALAFAAFALAFASIPVVAALDKTLPRFREAHFVFLAIAIGCNCIHCVHSHHILR